MNFLQKKSVQTILLLIICLTSFFVSLLYINRKSGYHIDEGMTLFLSNAHYNGAVTSISEYGFLDFLDKFVFDDNLMVPFQMCRVCLMM